MPETKHAPDQPGAAGTAFQFVEAPMIIRALPLAICLFWLAFESHFSPSFFVATLERSVASLAGGIDDVVSVETARPAATVLASAESQ
jgi:hypothetical protein